MLRTLHGNRRTRTENPSVLRHAMPKVCRQITTREVPELPGVQNQA